MTGQVPQIGVTKTTMRVTEDGDEDDIIHAGTLWIEPAGAEPIDCEITFYSLGSVRLVGMLEAAARGEPVESIMLALDAAALDTDD